MITVAIHHIGWDINLFYYGCGPLQYTCFGWYDCRVGLNYPAGVTMQISVHHYMDWELDHYG
jgi:hypothetical protein